jgi:S-adenosylmethionine decarboxylase
MIYQPGLHIIAELAVTNVSLLNSHENAKHCINQLINKHQLVNLGEVYHNFSPAGFTAVICLSESHISLHSWPEHKRLHLDVYLSNFLRDNNLTTQQIFNELVSFFSAEIMQQQTLKR